MPLVAVHLALGHGDDAPEVLAARIVEWRTTNGGFTTVEDLAAAGSPPDVPGFPWWAVILTGGVVLIGLYVWRAGCPPKARKHRA